MTTKQKEWHPIWSQLPQVLAAVAGVLIAVGTVVTALGVIYVAKINKQAAVEAREAQAESKKNGAQAVAAAENAALSMEKQRGDMHEVRKAVDGHLTEIMHDKMVLSRRMATKDPTPENVADAEKAEKQYALRLLAQKAQMDSNAKAKAEVDSKQEVPIPK